MNKYMAMTIQNAWNSNPLKPEDYQKDGLWYCGKCGMPREMHFVDPFDKDEYNVPKSCNCIDEERRKEDEKRQLEENEIRRRKCFADPEITLWNFAHDDGKGNVHAMQIAHNYVANFDRMFADGIGLIIHGNVGAGKSFMAACIANALIDKGKSCMLTDFTTIVNRPFRKDDDRNQYVRDLAYEYDLLVIDDLGRERNTSFATETVASVLEARNRSMRPLIITSNLTPKQLLNTKNIALKRIYSRIFEMCIPVKFTGADRREAKMQSNTIRYASLLGL